MPVLKQACRGSNLTTVVLRCSRLYLWPRMAATGGEELHISQGYSQFDMCILCMLAVHGLR